MFQDDIFESRMSTVLKGKIYTANNANWHFSRSVLESIRVLEGLNVSPSALAMRVTPRQLKGLLSEYWHIHFSEDFMTRVYNNLNGGKKGAIVKNPSSEELIRKTTQIALSDYAKDNNINPLQDGVEALVDAIRLKEEQALKRELSVNEISLISNKISSEFNRKVISVFNKPESSTGDWLIFFKDSNNVNYYLDALPHIDSRDEVAQENLAKSLKASRKQMNI